MISFARPGESRRFLFGSTSVALLVIGTAAAGCQCTNTFAIASGHLVVNPTTIAFGAVPIGTIQEVQVTVKNEGRGQVVVSSIELKTASTNLAVAEIFATDCTTMKPRSGPTMMTLIGGDCATFLVRYGPTAQVAVSDSVLVKSNDPNNPTITIPITGNGVGGTIQVCLVDSSGNTVTSSCNPAMGTTQAIANDPTVAFGSLAVGMSSVQKVRIFNIGKFNLAIDSGTLMSSFGDFSLVGGISFSPVIDPGNSYDVDITFTPSASAVESANLIIPSNDVVNPSLTVPITATADGPCLKATPNPLAFGAVAAGSTATLPITVTNCGNAAYNITTMLLTNGSAATVFSTPAAGAMNPIPTLPLMFAPGATQVVNVIYAPTSSTEMDTATFTVATDDSQHAIVNITGQGAFPGCMSSGANLTPTASIEVENGAVVVNPATTTFTPLTTVKLSGANSTSPAPSTITTYNWTLVSQPLGSVAAITGTGETVTLFMEIVGSYVVQLTVGNSDSCTSPPVTVTLTVTSGAGIHVQLTWPQNFGDMDLHYWGPGGKLGQTSPKGDLYYPYSQASACGTARPTSRGGCGACGAGEICDAAGTGCTLDWGSAGQCKPDGMATDDATLDVDQLFGYGPENVTHNAPFDGTYTVTAVYYAYDSCSIATGSGTVTAVVKIFVNGMLTWSGSMPNMAVCDDWDAAQIIVTNNGSSITVNPLMTPLYQDAGVCGGGI